MCGTVKPNRKNMPKEFNPKVLEVAKSDDPVFMRRQDLVACAWHHTKRVHFLRTVHNNLTIGKQVRYKRDGAQNGYRTVEKPVVSEMYNRYMSGMNWWVSSLVPIATHTNLRNGIKPSTTGCER
jgi:hypothetical protein